MHAQPTLLLTTKLYRPRGDAHWVARPDLMARLDAGLVHTLILLSAPPGFGKSTLVSQWLDQLSANGSPTKPQACWLSLDEGDNQLVQFLRYLIAAVRTCEPAACPTTLSLLGAAHQPEVDYLADVVVSELHALTADLLLVLDDYHLIRSDEVHRIMRHLLRYLPPQLRVVILARTDPPLHLGRLRMAQQITELRASDLRFTAEETRRFLDRRLDQALDEDLVRLVHTRTEGWVTALQLSSSAVQRQHPQQFLDQFHGHNRLLVGYLVEEVMERLGAPLREFVLYTALVDRFCVPLADALLADRLPGGSSQVLLAQVEAHNLFVIPLDQSGDWLRYHDLFRDFLRHQLKRTESPARVAQLHQIASTWFAERGLIEEALHHALAAGDEAAAAELLFTHFHAMLDRQNPGPTLTRWLAFFPAASIQTRPGLRLAQIYLSAFGIGPVVPVTQLGDLETELQGDPTLLATRRQALLADLNLVRGVLAYWHGDPQRAILLLQRALDQQAPTHLFARVQALIHLAVAHACTGADVVAHMLLREALAEAKAQQRPMQVVFLGTLAILHLHAGNLMDVADLATQAVATIDGPYADAAWQGLGFVELWYGWAHYLLGIVRYEQNDLDRAAHHWQRVEAMRYRASPGVFSSSLLGLALVAQANGVVSEALAYAQAAREFAAEIRRPVLLDLSAAFEVRLALLNGQATDAGHRTQEIKTKADQGMRLEVELPALTRIRALLAVGTPAALTEGLAFASTCLCHAETVHNARQVIQIGALQALILHGLQRTEEAFEVLTRALALGEPGRFTRTFVDLGAPMANLLRQLGATRGQSPQVKRLLAAFPATHDLAERRALTAQYAKLYGITPLTSREIELLALIRQRLSINEIATTLVISPHTVKKHTNNIYTKLGVRNRREALAKAEALSLLPLPK
jgi:LuxR family transcriptional regulator, maltose regulon positive regulatory protein